MVDHQFLGDGFGYHPTYPAVGNNTNTNLGAPNLGNLGHAMNVCGPQSAGANTLMAQMMSSGTMAAGVGGGLGYPTMMPAHDYQLLGDRFGYHSSYSTPGGNPNNNSAGSNLGSVMDVNGPQSVSANNSFMAQMMSSGASVGGTLGYHSMMPTHGSHSHGIPPRPLGFGPHLGLSPGSGILTSSGGRSSLSSAGSSSLSDVSKLHGQYPSCSFIGVNSPQTSARRRQMRNQEARCGHSLSGYPITMGGGPGSSLGPMPTHNGPLPPQSTMRTLPGSNNCQSRSLMSGYSEARMMSPIISQRHAGACAGIPPNPQNSSHCPGSYSSLGSSSLNPSCHANSSASDLWYSQGSASHMQQSTSFSYPNGITQVSNGGSSSVHSRNGQPLLSFGSSEVISDYHQNTSNISNISLHTHPHKHHHHHQNPHHRHPIQQQSQQPSPQQASTLQRSQSQPQQTSNQSCCNTRNPSDRPSSSLSSHISTNPSPMPTYPSPQASPYNNGRASSSNVSEKSTSSSCMVAAAQAAASNSNSNANNSVTKALHDLWSKIVVHNQNANFSKSVNSNNPIQPDDSHYADGILNYLNQDSSLIQSHSGSETSQSQSHSASPRQSMPPLSVEQQNQLSQSQPPPQSMLQQTPSQITSTDSSLSTSNLSSASLSHDQTHLQSQPQLMTQDNIVPKESCFDSTFNIDAELLNSSLNNLNNNQLAESHPMPSQQTQSNPQLAPYEYQEKAQERISQSGILPGSNSSDTAMNSIHDDEKLAALEDDLNYLTAADTAAACALSKVKSNEVGTQAEPLLTSESQNLTTLSESSSPTLRTPTLVSTANSTSNCDLLMSANNPDCSLKNHNTSPTSIINTNETMVNQMLTIPTEIKTESRGISPSATNPGANDSNDCENKRSKETTLKKKKKCKDSKTKFNGVKVTKVSQACDNGINKKHEARVEPSVKIVPVNDDCFTNRLPLPTNKCVTTCKPLEITNFRKQSDQEAKFFKMRPVTHSNVTTVSAFSNHSIDFPTKTIFKSGKKRKLDEAQDKSTHDEYEFPDSPNPISSKKGKKINSENSKKKITDKVTPIHSSFVNKKHNFNAKVKTSSSAGTALSKLSLNEKNGGNIKSPPKNIPQSNGTEQKLEEAKPQAPKPIVTQKKSQATEVRQRINSEGPKKPIVTVQEIKSPPPTASALSPTSSTSKSNQSIINTNKKPISNSLIPSAPNRTNITSIPPASTSTASNSSTIHNSTHIAVTANTLTTIVPISSNALGATLAIVNTPTVLSALPAQPKNAINAMTQSAGTNTPRRRSQDKKALTIREGLMRTGDFVVALDEASSELPMIWRIEGKSLLQRFEPSEQDGTIVYTNTSSYSAWNPTVKQRYTGVDVRIMGCSRTKIVVEKLGLTKKNPSNGEYDQKEKETNSGASNSIASRNGDAIIEKGKNQSEKSIASLQHQADFEVFIQTLISQALDSNFISEIIKENDEYFLSHLQAIDEYCLKKRSRFFTKVKWDAQIVKCVETFPNFSLILQSHVGDSRCRLCHDDWSTQILDFNGKTYDPTTLEMKEPDFSELKQTKYAACNSCKDKITLFSRLHHQKYNFFIKCREKVEQMRGGVDDKDSPMILEECLKDTKWMQSLFKQFEEIWQSCDRIR